METLVVSLLLIGCYQLAFTGAENAFLIVCELINATSVALVAVGSCQFHRRLVLRTESYLPLSLVLADVDQSCDPTTWHGRAFNSNSVHRWLPLVVAETLEFMSASRLMIVFSPPFVRIATSTAKYLSSTHIESALVTARDFLDPRVDHSTFTGHDGSQTNSSVPIFLAVSKADAELILLKNDTFAHYWLVLCEEELELSELPESPQFCITPGLPTSSVGTDLDPQPEAQHVFDEYGRLRTDHYDITVVTTEGKESAGHWNHSTGLSLKPAATQLFSQDFFANTTLIVGTEEAKPFVFLENGTWKGFCIDMLEELSLRMGFKYVIKRSVDNLWGGTNADGTWNGLVGMAARREIDMAVGPISVTADRESVVDFTKPFMESAAGMMMMRYEDPVVKMFRTLMPFTTHVWMALAGLLCAISLLFGLINKFSPAKGVPGEVNSDRWIDGMWDSAWIIYGSFMEQGAERIPRGLAGRVVLGLWWVFTILTMASYTASLAAFLTYSLAEVPINSIYDLAQQSYIIPLVKNGTNLFELFRKQETETYQKVYEMLLEAPVVESTEQSMRLVRNGPYAFMTDREQLDLLQKADCEGLVLAEETFNNNGLGFFVPEGDSLLKPLSYSIIKLMEAGLLDKWRRKWWSAKDVCSQDLAVSRVQSLKLDSTAGPFILYACTTVLAFLALLGEKVVNRFCPLCRAVFGGKAVVV
ncbi:glutamate receptor 4-like [Babylonia areolata]|uniref:glutamate receptor 4-like n=1 Tax=Babylonia areolata TaxID=304850 RepID=UPI003FD0D618